MNFHKPPVTYVSDVTLNVKDLEKSTLFYEKVLGFKILEVNDDTVRFTADGENVLLTIHQPADVEMRDQRTTGLFHFALLLPTRNDLANVVRHFSKIGLQFGAGDHWVSEAIYLSDMEGNGIEIYADRDNRDWRWMDDQVAMTTEAVDFEDLLSKEKEGVWQGMPEGTVMGHIHLQVAEIEANQHFYVDGLQFEIVSRIENQALFISDHKYHHHIAFNTWAGRGIPNRARNMTGLSAYTIVLPNEEKRTQLLSHLKDMNIAVTEEDGNYYVTDPSETRIDLKLAN